MSLTSHKRRLVVVGNGMAGARTVEEILRRDGAQRFEITVFGDEPHGNYNRIMLSNLLGGTQSPADILLNPIPWYAENGIRLHAPERVIAIDRAAKTVTGSAGTVAPYDTLLFATGSRPFIPSVEGLRAPDGSDKHGIFTFRTIDDCRKIAGCADKCARALVIGGGLLGLEAARGLLKFGLEVHVAHIGPYLMNNQLDPSAGALLKTALGRMGIQVHLGKVTQQILGDDSVAGVRFADGTTLDCDMIVISAGITPNVEVARDCGLTVRRAIVVDDQMRSIEDDSIYAVGECAEHRGRVYGLVAPLWEQGTVLADHLTGRKSDVAYQGSKVATKLKAADISLATMGVKEPELDTDEVVLYTESRRGIYQKLILRDGVLIGGILLGDTDRAASLIQAFDRGMPLPENRRAALFEETEAPARPESRLQRMPDTDKVCNCMGLTKGAIRQCVAAGNTTLPMVQAACRAGMGCGTCKPLVQEIIQWLANGDDGETAAAVAAPPAAPGALAGLPLATPEFTGALKVLIREVVNWACSD